MQNETIIYVILCHTDPISLAKLLEKLNHSNSVFVIQLDSRTDLLEFQKITHLFHSCYYNEKRFPSSWGSFDIIRATLSAFQFVFEHFDENSRIVLLSGTDYPIKSNEFILRYFSQHENTIFIDYFPIPNDKWYEGGINRFPLFDELKNDIDFFGGSQWFSLPFKVLAIIFDFIDANPDFFEYFHHVKIPDESFFQTLFLNCGDLFIQKNLVNHSLHYIEWDELGFKPNTLTLDSYQKIIDSPRLYARKFHYLQSNTLILALNSLTS